MDKDDASCSRGASEENQDGAAAEPQAAAQQPVMDAFGGGGIVPTMITSERQTNIPFKT